VFVWVWGGGDGGFVLKSGSWGNRLADKSNVMADAMEDVVEGEKEEGVQKIRTRCRGRSLLQKIGGGGQGGKGETDIPFFVTWWQRMEDKKKAIMNKDSRIESPYVYTLKAKKVQNLSQIMQGGGGIMGGEGEKQKVPAPKESSLNNQQIWRNNISGRG